VAASPFLFDGLPHEERARGVLERLPPVAGNAIRLHAVAGLKDARGAVHAAAFLRERRIAFDCPAAEFPRIFVHELFHFVWARAGNPARWRYEQLLREERRAGVRGELGWSAEWRKRGLAAVEVRRRGRAWREYCCESFCDTAAWLYSGTARHPEFTLGTKWRRRREAWFRRELGGRPLPV
jgi:hypothetical protein